MVESSRLDYVTGDGVRSYPEGGDTYGYIKFKTEEIDKISIPYGKDFGGMNTDGPPCTLNGFTAARNGEVVPEWTVAPVYTDHNKCNIITISGADNMGRTNFIKYFALQMLNSEIDTHIYIADDFRRKLSDIGQENVSYDLDPDEFIQKIIMIEVLLEEKYKRLIHQENPEKEITLIIINSQEVYTAISDSKDALNALKNIMGKYKVLNVYLLFGAVPNAQIAYGSPDIYKMMKETKSILFFDNLDNCKIVDIPLAIKRKNQKKIEPGDAYYIFEDEVSKVRIPLVLD